MVPVSELHLHESNARQGDVGAIIESIKANGFIRPIVVQRSTGKVLAGNHALRAAVSLGMDLVPVAYVDCDDAAALRILLVENRCNDLACYDNAALSELLQSLPTLEGTCFDMEALNELMSDLEHPFVPEPETEAPPAPRSVTCPECGHEFTA
jgi:ParB-like chromosome segregation protein Spo0J